MPAAYLEVLQGPAEGQVLPLGEAQTTTIGRVPGNQLVVRDPTISRRHARVFQRREQWLLADLNSTHGSFVNGEKVTRSELQDGDEIRLGETVLHFRIGDPATAIASAEQQAPDEIRLEPASGTGTSAPAPGEVSAKGPAEEMTLEGEDPFADEPGEVPAIALRDSSPALKEARASSAASRPAAAAQPGAIRWQRKEQWLIRPLRPARWGIFQHDLAQRGPVTRYALIVLAVVVAAGLFYATMALVSATSGGDEPPPPAGEEEDSTPRGPVRPVRPSRR